MHEYCLLTIYFCKVLQNNWLVYLCVCFVDINLNVSFKFFVWWSDTRLQLVIFRRENIWKTGKLCYFFLWKFCINKHFKDKNTINEGKSCCGKILIVPTINQIPINLIHLRSVPLFVWLYVSFFLINIYSFFINYILLINIIGIWRHVRTYAQEKGKTLSWKFNKETILLI